MSSELSLRETKKEWHGTLQAYVIGFIGSIVLTAISFGLVISQALSGTTLVYTLIGLALLQAIVQLLFFLHVGQEPKPRWETLIFLFMVLILAIIALGSIWIMHDLDDRVMRSMMEKMDD